MKLIVWEGGRERGKAAGCGRRRGRAGRRAGERRTSRKLPHSEATKGEREREEAERDPSD